MESHIDPYQGKQRGKAAVQRMSGDDGAEAEDEEGGRESVV